MDVTNDVNQFVKACEHLMASIALHRPLMEAEVLLVRHYCKELQETVAPAPASAG